MRTLELFLCVLISVFLATPALATECVNAGAATITAPNDTDDVAATACGNSAVADGSASIALGNTASSPGLQSTALGVSAGSGGNYSTAVGGFTVSTGASSTALGYGANALGEYGAALGAFAFNNQDNSVVLGSIAGLNEATVYANVGIGTPAPLEAVDVERSAGAARFQLTSFTSIAGEAPQFIQRRARGTTAAPTAVQNNDNLGLFSFRGHNGTNMGGSRATITAQAAGAFSASSTPTRLIFATTPVGSTAPQSVLVITPDGKVQVKGVNLNVPDYVFEDDYELMPLDELKSFIDENGHLPGIASAQQVKHEGLDLAGSQMSQLQKIEELTLYTLQLQEQLVTQQEHSKAQESRLEAQQERILELEAQRERIDHMEAQLNRTLAALD